MNPEIDLHEHEREHNVQLHSNDGWITMVNKNMHNLWIDL